MKFLKVKKKNAKKERPHCVQLQPQQSACSVCVMGVEMLKCESNNDRSALNYYY